MKLDMVRVFAMIAVAFCCVVLVLSMYSRAALKRVVAIEKRIDTLEKTTASFNNVISRAEVVLGRIESDLKRNPSSWGWSTNTAKP